jgi:hypothetical protein
MADGYDVQLDVRPAGVGRPMQIVSPYEHRGEHPISRMHFIRRLIRHRGVIVMLVTASTIIGTAGYHWLGDGAWIDAFLNACMLLGGMGPIGELHSNRGKIFVSLFALYAGLVFLVSTAIFRTPVVHRVIHQFHWDADNAKTSSGDNGFSADA